MIDVPYDDYQETGIPWLPEFPAHWTPARRETTSKCSECFLAELPTAGTNRTGLTKAMGFHRLQLAT